MLLVTLATLTAFAPAVLAALVVDPTLACRRDGPGAADEEGEAEADVSTGFLWEGRGLWLQT